MAKEKANPSFAAFTLFLRAVKSQPNNNNSNNNMDNNNTNILDQAADIAAEATEEEWLTTAPRFYVEGRAYVDAWWAKEVYTRLKMILFVASNFDPGPDQAAITEYREGLANIAKHGVPILEKPSTPDSHD